MGSEDGLTQVTDVRVLRWPEIQKLTGLSRSTIWRLEKVGRFPRRFKIASKAVGWTAGDVRRWVDEMQATSATSRGITDS